jgi:hypothetical protein
MTPVMNANTITVVDSDVVAARRVMYCEGVSDAHLLVGRTFRCATLPLLLTIVGMGSGGTSKLVAFAYSGDSIPSGTRLEFVEVATA